MANAEPRHPSAPHDLVLMAVYLPLAVVVYWVLAEVSADEWTSPAWPALAASAVGWLVGVPLGEWRRALRVPATVVPRERLLDVLRGMGYRRQKPDGDEFRSHFPGFQGRLWLVADGGDSVITARRATLWRLRNVLDMDRRPAEQDAPKTVHQVKYSP